MNSAVRWSAEAAWEWYRCRPVPCGTNFVPSTPANWTEFWQESTFARELLMAAEIELNSVRVFLPFHVWEADAEGLLGRMERFLSLAAAQSISVVFCLFDDVSVSGRDPYLGPQEVTRGVFVSAWTASPGPSVVVDRSRWPALEAYVRGVVGAFASDERVLFWDIYNEPGHNNLGVKSLSLLRDALAWARAAEPFQPLTAAVHFDYVPGVHSSDEERKVKEWMPEFVKAAPALNEATLELSDMVTFLRYGDVSSTAVQSVASPAWDGPSFARSGWLLGP